GALGRIRDARAIPDLITIFHDKEHWSWSMHWAAAEALGRIGDTTIVPDLIDALDSTLTNERQIALEALWRIGTSEALAAANAKEEEAINWMKSRGDEHGAEIAEAWFLACWDRARSD